LTGGSFPSFAMIDHSFLYSPKKKRTTRLTKIPVYEPYRPLSEGEIPSGGNLLFW